MAARRADATRAGRWATRSPCRQECHEPVFPNFLYWVHACQTSALRLLFFSPTNLWHCRALIRRRPRISCAKRQDVPRRCAADFLEVKAAALPALPTSLPTLPSSLPTSTLATRRGGSETNSTFTTGITCTIATLRSNIDVLNMSKSRFRH